MGSHGIFAFAVVYLLLFGALGSEVSFLPYFLATTGVSASQIGLVLAAGTIVQVCVAPLFGLAADRIGIKLVLGLSAAGAALSFSLFLTVPQGTLHVLLVYALFAMATASLNPLTDALSVPACLRAGIPYGWVRGMGSAGFFVGVVGSSAIIARAGIGSIVLLTTLLLGLMSAMVPTLPPALAPAAEDPASGGVWTLLADRNFRRILLVAALVLGGHAMSDAFIVIHWTNIGIGTQTVGILLAIAVVSELLVFVVVGPMLLARLGPSACAVVGATAGIIRWAVLAETQSVGLALAAQMLHGLTFSLVHLACMQVLAVVAPRRYFATAQSLYGICGNAIASGAIMLAAGALFATLHAHAFWLPSALCFCALPAALKLGPGATHAARRTA